MKIIRISDGEIVFISNYPSVTWRVFNEEFNSLAFKVVSLGW